RPSFQRRGHVCRECCDSDRDSYRGVMVFTKGSYGIYPDRWILLIFGWRIGFECFLSNCASKDPLLSFRRLNLNIITGRKPAAHGVRENFDVRVGLVEVVLG